MANKRIYELDELTRPTTGYEIICDKSGESAAKKLNLESLLYRDSNVGVCVEYLPIGNWNMKTALQHSIALTNPSNIIGIEPGWMYSDSPRNVYWMNFLWDSYFYIYTQSTCKGQVTLSGTTGTGEVSGTSGTASLTGSTDNSSDVNTYQTGLISLSGATAGTTVTGTNAATTSSSGTLLLTARISSSGNAADCTVVSSVVPGITVSAVSKTDDNYGISFGGVPVSFNTNNSFVTFHADGTAPFAELKFLSIGTNGLYVDLDVDGSFYVSVFYAAGVPHTQSFDSHTHTFTADSHTHNYDNSSHRHTFSLPTHNHTLSLSAHSHSITGLSHNHAIPTLLSSTGTFQGGPNARSVNIGCQYTIGESSLLLSHNHLGGADYVFTDFGVASGRNTASTMNNFQTPVGGNRGYIKVIRDFS